MATRGRKPTASVLKLVTNNPGNRPVPEEEITPNGRPVKPKVLKRPAAKFWDQFIAPAFWLTEADTQKAFMWCCLAAEFEAGPDKMVASRIGQLRALGSELGFDPVARARLGTRDNGKKKDPTERFFE